MVNWTYSGTEVTEISQIPKGVIGFIYKVIDHTNGKIYIGRKKILSTRKRHFGKRELAKMTDKRLKTYEMITKEAKGWQKYTGSCKALNEEIEKGIMYTKEILQYCRSKQEMTYYELKYQMLEEVIEPGNSSYNENISGKFYPKLFVPQ